MPDSYLTMKQRGRKDEIVSQLPDILDLMTVSVEAGLGFDAAIAKVCERMHGPAGRASSASCCTRCASARAARRP